MQTNLKDIHSLRPETPMDQFFIPATSSLQERRPHTLKHGDTFAICDHNGDVLSGTDSPDGIYHRDTRYLSHLHLAINGRRPMLLSSTIRDDNATLTCDLTNPDLIDNNGKLVLDHDLIHLRRTRFLWNGRFHERLTVKNYDERAQRIRIEIGFAADFADLFEARGTVRAKRGQALPSSISGEDVVLSYVGLDDRKRSTQLSFDPPPDHLSADRSVYELQLAPQEMQSFFIEVACDPDETGRSGYRSFFFALRDARRALRASSSRAAFIRPIVDNAFSRETDKEPTAIASDLVGQQRLVKNIFVDFEVIPVERRYFCTAAGLKIDTASDNLPFLQREKK